MTTGAGHPRRWRSGDVRLLKEGLLALASVLVLVACFMPRSNGGRPARWVQLSDGEAVLFVAGFLGCWLAVRWLLGLPLPGMARSGPDDDTHGAGVGISVPDCSDGGDGGD